MSNATKESHLHTLNFPETPRLGREKTYVDYMSDNVSIASMRSTYGNALEVLVPFGREHFRDKLV